MFPERLKQLRKERGMTQADLAKELGVSKATIGMWETGKRRPSFDLLDDLCTVFNRRLYYILGHDDDPSEIIPTKEQIDQIGTWAAEKDFEEFTIQYVMLDEYGKRAVEAVLDAEFDRCRIEDTLFDRNSVSVIVKLRDTPSSSNDTTD